MIVVFRIGCFVFVGSFVRMVCLFRLGFVFWCFAIWLNLITRCGLPFGGFVVWLFMLVWWFLLFALLVLVIGLV